LELLSGIFSVRLVDVIDIILFAILLYQVYNLVKGTTAIKIFVGIIAVYVVWKVVKALQMQLLGEILGQFISIGVIVLIIVFQPEIRQFLLLLGNTRFIRSEKRKRFLFWKIKVENPFEEHIDTIVHACKKLADSKTGALIVITRENELRSYVETGQVIDARISGPLLESIFFRNSPLHDGAVIISGDVIRAARCILPVSNNSSVPVYLGLRHRAAIGITERSDAIALIVSEERGKISYSMEGKISENVTPSQLNDFLRNNFKSEE
jgi:diadenylate cyclase